MLGHDAGAAAQDHPGQQRAQQGVADARPGGGDAVLPAKLSRIAHEDHRGEIAGAVGEGGEPGAHRAASQHKAVYVSGMAAAVKADPHHDGEENQKKSYFDCHRFTLSQEKISRTFYCVKL